MLCNDEFSLDAESGAVLYDTDIMERIGPRVRRLADTQTEAEKLRVYDDAAAAARFQVKDCAKEIFQGEGSVAVLVTGYKVPAYDGNYQQVGEHEGFPHFKNEAGHHLYRYQKSKSAGSDVGDNSWRLGPTFSPNYDSSVAYCVTKDGRLPVGKVVEWKCFEGAGVWSDRTFSVAKPVVLLPDDRTSRDRELARKVNRQIAKVRSQLSSVQGIEVSGAGHKLVNGSYLEVEEDGSVQKGAVRPRPGTA
jgi:hypothetical protein